MLHAEERDEVWEEASMVGQVELLPLVPVWEAEMGRGWRGGGVQR